MLLNIQNVNAVCHIAQCQGLSQADKYRENRVEAGLTGLDRRVQDIESRLPYAVTRTAVVAYDAFGNITGQLSRSMAFLSESGDGIVLSVLVSREETLFFTKEIRAGVGSEMLSPEEDRAVANAVGR